MRLYIALVRKLLYQCFNNSAIYGNDPAKNIFKPSPSPLLRSVIRFVVCFVVVMIICYRDMFGPCFVLHVVLCDLSSFAIILLR